MKIIKWIQKLLAAVFEMCAPTFMKCRRVWYREYFTKCGANLTLTGPTAIVNKGTITAGDNLTVFSYKSSPVVLFAAEGANLSLGDNVAMGQGARIVCTKAITILQNCWISEEVLILDTDFHSVAGQPIRTEPIVIGPYAWIASRSTILRGVTIGEGAIVAAGSLVTESVPPYTLVGGVPAKFIRSLPKNPNWQQDHTYD
jgi:acetyltransferase-like isoleucine patch superfamily enzyme